MKRWHVLAVCGLAVLFVGAGRRLTGWEAPYTPSRLEWLALQCNAHHGRSFDAAHVSFLAVPPNKLEAIIKLSPNAMTKDAKLRQDVQLAAKEYASQLAGAMGWTDPLEVDAIEVLR